MTVRYMSVYGAIAGFLLGTIIILICDIPLGDACLRLLVLSVCGAWMLSIISWLGHLLPQSKERNKVGIEN